LESGERVTIGEWIVKEGSCHIFLDEAHRWMNARAWTQEGRQEILEWFALARKRGFVVWLVSQRAQNLDVQVRELFEDHIQLTNLRNSARFLGVPVIPFNLFIAAWFNHAYPGDGVQRYQRYRLNWRKRLYNTMDVGSFGEKAGVDAPGRLWLPLGVDGESETPSVPDASTQRVGAPASAAPQPLVPPPVPPVDPSL